MNKLRALHGFRDNFTRFIDNGLFATEPKKTCSLKKSIVKSVSIEITPEQLRGNTPSGVINFASD